MSFFSNQCILITGGTGSFGNVVLLKLLETDVSEVRIFSRDEKKQDDLRREINNDKVKFYIGDIRDYTSILSATVGVDFVFSRSCFETGPFL